MIAIFMKASGALIGPCDYFKPKVISPASAKSSLSSWPGIAVRRTASLPLAYARPSTLSRRYTVKDVDAEHKAGHDELYR
jgi:hypothetical protein